MIRKHDKGITITFDNRGITITRTFYAFYYPVSNQSIDIIVAFLTTYNFDENDFEAIYRVMHCGSRNIQIYDGLCIYEFSPRRINPNVKEELDFLYRNLEFRISADAYMLWKKDLYLFFEEIFKASKLEACSMKECGEESEIGYPPE